MIQIFKINSKSDGPQHTINFEIKSNDFEAEIVALPNLIIRSPTNKLAEFITSYSFAQFWARFIWN